MKLLIMQFWKRTNRFIKIFIKYVHFSLYVLVKKCFNYFT
jgi:hypothetical protein